MDPDHAVGPRNPHDVHDVAPLGVRGSTEGAGRATLSLLKSPGESLQLLVREHIIGELPPPCQSVVAFSDATMREKIADSPSDIPHSPESIVMSWVVWVLDHLEDAIPVSLEPSRKNITEGNTDPMKVDIAIWMVLTVSLVDPEGMLDHEPPDKAMRLGHVPRDPSVCLEALATIRD